MWKVDIFLKLIALLVVVEGGYVFKTDYFTQPVDQFSFAINGTYQMKYLYNDSWWSKDGPIFFYTGNEGDIELFAQNTGFIWEVAPEFGALVLFAEHRYYGVSLPFGNESYTSREKLGYLSSEQALGDFARFLSWFKYHKGGQRSPVIAFGGSYGGMLTAWMRIKYPHIITGGIAASAPILQFTGMTPCGTFNKIVKADFDQASPKCSAAIRNSWDPINKMGNLEDGRDWLYRNWKLCKPLKNSSEIANLKYWLTNVYSYLAMVNYPYPSSFLEPLPGNPVQKFCDRLNNSNLGDEKLLLALVDATNVYFNYTGTVKCLDIYSEATQSLGDIGWDYQACTEMVMPMCSDGINDFFEPNAWNLEEYEAYCKAKYNVDPRPYMAEIIYGGRSLQAASNIVFSNGLLDPWSGGGVLTNMSESVLAVLIPEGAHHLDLRASNPADPPSVIAARNLEKGEIAKWIAQHAQTQLKTNSIDEMNESN